MKPILPITQGNQQVLTSRKPNGYLKYQTTENAIPIIKYLKKVNEGKEI